MRKDIYLELASPPSLFRLSTMTSKDVHNAVRAKNRSLESSTFEYRVQEEPLSIVLLPTKNIPSWTVGPVDFFAYVLLGLGSRVYQRMTTIHPRPIKDGVNVVGFEGLDSMARIIADDVAYAIDEPVVPFDPKKPVVKRLRDRFDVLEF